MTPSDRGARPADPELLLSDQRWLVALAKSLVGDAHAAEDVVQEARIAAWLHAPGDPSRAGGWLRRVVRNLAIRTRRSDTRRSAREAAAAPREEMPATEELVARVEMQRAVAEAVLALAEPYRSTILLRFFDRLPPREIAARLDAPVETVRTRLKRALEQLRERLDREYGARDAWSALLLPWTTVVTTTTKVGVKVAVAAVLIGSAGIATWRGVRQASARANEGGAPIEAASAAEPTAASRKAGDDAGAGAATADGAARSVESVVHGRRMAIGFEHIHLAARIVDERTHTPIAGARMTVSYWLAPGRAEAIATSDADGRVVLEFGPAESDNVRYFVAHADYAQLEGYQAFDAADARAAGERYAEHDFGELALDRGALLSGHVVRMPDRAPVADAKLFVLRNDFPHDFWLTESESLGSAGPDGSFELPKRFAAQSWDSPIVYAVAPCGVGWISPSIVKGRDRVENLAIEIDVPARLDVLVVDESGRPLSGVSVTVLPRFPPLGPSSYDPYRSEAPEIPAGEWHDLFWTTSGPDGHASLSRLPEGRSDELLHRGGGRPGNYTVFAHAPTGRRRTAVAKVHLEHGTRTELRLVARPLVPRTIRGRVSDDRGQPVADARIELVGGSSATTDEAGLYVLPPFIADRDWLGFKVAAEGLGSIEQDLLDSELGDRIVLIRGEDGSVACEELVVDFKLSRCLVVKGRCIDTSGNGVANVRVEFQQNGSQRSSPIRSEGVTGEDGRFRIEGVMPGTGSLAVSPPQEFRSVASRTMKAGAQDVEVRLVAATPGRARVIADVVDSATQQPADVARAFLHPVDYGNVSPSCSCAVGIATAEGLRVGRWWINVRTANGCRVQRGFEVTDPDEEVRLHLETVPCASIDGHVARSDGQAIPPKRRPTVFSRAGSNFSDDGGHSVDVDERISTDVVGACARVDADGSFRLRDVAPGTPIRLYSFDPEAIGEAVVILEPGEKRHVEIVTRPGVELSFRFAERLASGRFRLEVARDDGPFGLVSQDDSIRDGEVWEKAFFAPGRLRWRVTHVSEEEETPSLHTVEGELEVVADQPQVVEIRGLK